MTCICCAAEAKALGPLSDAARQQMQSRANALAGALQQKRHAGDDSSATTADDDIVRLDGWAQLLPDNVRPWRTSSLPEQLSACSLLAHVHCALPVRLPAVCRGLPAGRLTHARAAPDTM